MRTVLVKMQIRVVGHERYLHKKNFLTLIPLQLGLLEQDFTYCLVYPNQLFLELSLLGLTSCF